MPHPWTPNDLKELIPSTTGSVCEKLIRLLREFPVRFYEMISYEIKEDGTFTQEYIDDICDLACFSAYYNGGGGDPGPGPDPGTSQQVYNYVGDFEYFIVPAGVTSINVESWAAGGGGGGASIQGEGGVGPGSGNAAGGGGGGEYRKTVGTVVTPGESIRVFVGGGGTAGSGNQAGASGATSLAERALGGSIVATAGGQGGGKAFGSGDEGTGGAGGTGGTGGSIVEEGTAGGPGVYTWGGGLDPAEVDGGPGGLAFEFTATPAGTGAAGQAPGNGGGGGVSATGSQNGSGGRGGHGRVIITWTTP